MSKRDYEFDNMHPGATVLRSVDPMVIEKPRAHASRTSPRASLGLYMRTPVRPFRSRPM